MVAFVAYERAYEGVHCVHTLDFITLMCESVTKSYKLLQKVTIFNKKVTKCYREINKMLQKTQKL